MNLILIKMIRSEKGQILTETMVALSMVVIGILGILSLLSYSIGTNRIVSDQYIAAALASEGVEIVKHISDNNVVQDRPFNAGLLPGSYEVEFRTPFLVPFQDRFLRFNEEMKYYYYVDGRETPFKRKITLSQGAAGGGEIKVVSLVSWIGKGGIELKVDLESHIFNWRQ